MPRAYFAAVDRLFDHAFGQGYIVLSDKPAAFIPEPEWQLIDAAARCLDHKQLLDSYQNFALRGNLTPAWLIYQTENGSPQFIFQAFKGQAAAGLIGYLMALPLESRMDHRSMRHFTVLPFRTGNSAPGPGIELRIAKDYIRLSWESAAPGDAARLEQLAQQMRSIGLFEGLQVAKTSPRLAWDELGAADPAAKISPELLVSDEGMQTLIERIAPKKVRYPHGGDAQS